jgi:glutathione peroxidase-family protein
MKKLTLLTISLSLIIFFAGTTKKAGYEIGDEVKNFTLKSVDGNMVSTSDYGSAKGFIVIFDCNTCPYSKMYQDRIMGLDEKYATKGYPVLAINSNDPERSPGDTYEEMVSYAKSNKYKHAYLYDADQSVAKNFGATSTPHVYILQKEGEKMVVSYIGAIDNNTKSAKKADKKYVESAVDALLEGKKPTETKTKAIGCTIKWKAA